MISGDGNFHIGDKVVYPNHGVGVIEQISSRTIGETVEKFYLLKIKANSLKVMVPFHNVNTVGLRRGVKNSENQKIVDFFSDGQVDNNTTLEHPFNGNSHRKRTATALQGFCSTQYPSVPGIGCVHISQSFSDEQLGSRIQGVIPWHGARKGQAPLSNERPLPSAIILDKKHELAAIDWLDHTSPSSAIFL